MYVAHMHVTYENTVRKSDVSVEAYAFAKLTGDRARYARRQDSTEACETGFVRKYRQRSRRTPNNIMFDIRIDM